MAGDEVWKGDKAPNGQENSLKYADGPAAEHGAVSPIVDDIALWRPCRGVRHKRELFVEVRGHQIQHESGNTTLSRRHRPHEEDARAGIAVFRPSESLWPRATGDKRANSITTSQLRSRSNRSDHLRIRVNWAPMRLRKGRIAAKRANDENRRGLVRHMSSQKSVHASKSERNVSHALTSDCVSRIYTQSQPALFLIVIRSRPRGSPCAGRFGPPPDCRFCG